VSSRASLLLRSEFPPRLEEKALADPTRARSRPTAAVFLAGFARRRPPATVGVVDVEGEGAVVALEFARAAPRERHGDGFTSCKSPIVAYSQTSFWK
jgi:hypothetical protein